MNSNALPTPAHPHLIAAHSSLDDAASALNAARAEVRRLEDRAAILLADDDVLREVLADWAAVQREEREHSRRYSHVEGGTYGPNGTPEMEAEWSAICRRRWPIEQKLKAIADEILDARERRSASAEAAE